MTSCSREEQTNWYRVCRLLIEGGKELLFDFLIQSIGSCTLDSYLAAKRKDVNKVKQIHPSQKDILYPPGGGNTDPRQWDITLTSCIIQNLIQLTNQQQKIVNDIRDLRNEVFGHCGEFRMDQSEFQTNWSRIKQVLSTASVGLLNNVGSFSLKSLEDDIEMEEVTYVGLNAMKHILDNWINYDIVEGQAHIVNMMSEVKTDISDIRSVAGGQLKELTEVKSAIERQSVGHSEIKSAIEKQTEGHSEMKCAIERQSESHSEVKSVMERQTKELSEVKSAMERQSEGQSEVKSALEEVKTVVEGLHSSTAGVNRPFSETKDFSSPIPEGQSHASRQSPSPNEPGTAVENVSLSSTTTDAGLQTCEGLPSEFEDLKSHLIAYYKKYVIKSPTAVNTARGKTDIDDLYVEPELVLVDHTSLTQETATEEDISIEHIFQDDEHKCRLIYLNGDAGMGKTSLTKYLVSEWCKSHSQGQSMHDVNTLSSMKRFDFLFHIPLKNAKCKYEISEMIIAQLLKDYPCNEPGSKVNTTLDRFLNKLFEYWSVRCLIILDGLDEWKAPEQSECSAVSDRIPGRSPHLKYTILTTSRPWKMEQLRLEECEIDRQLKLKGVKFVSGFGEKIVSYYNKRLKKDKNYAHFELVLEDEGLEKMTETPILLKQLICLWFHEQSFGKSKTEIYTNMVDLLLRLAEQRENVKRLNGNERRSFERVLIASCFRKGGRCEKYKSLLLSLGRLAFETQLCGERESRLVFETDETEAYGMSKEEIDVCLSVGLLTQDIVPEPVRDMKSLSFIHKTFHEFFTALYLSAYGENLNYIETRFSYLNLDSLLDMEDTFLFLGGMCPLLLKENISKYLVEILNKDETVVRCHYDYLRQNNVNIFGTLESYICSKLCPVQSMILACCEECSRSGHIPLYLPVPDYINYDSLFSSEQLSQEKLNILDTCLRHYPLQLKSFYFGQDKIYNNESSSLGIKQHLDFTPYKNLCRLVILFSNQTCINLQVSMPKLEYIAFRNVSSLQLLSMIKSARKLKVLHLKSTQCNNPSTGFQSSCDLDLSGHSELIHLYLKDMSLEALAINSSLRIVYLENICLLKHDSHCNLMTLFSDTRSIAHIHLESVTYREHGKGVDCGYSIELSECRQLEELYLKGISAESVTLSPSIRRLTLENIHIFNHDALCSLIASISNTRSFTGVHLVSVRCTEHDNGVDCGYPIELSECGQLVYLHLEDITAESVTLSQSIRELVLKNIYTFKHDSLCSLLASISNMKSLTEEYLESVRCREHGRGVTCGYTIDLTGHDTLEDVCLHDLSPASIRIGNVKRLVSLCDIHTLHHEELSELLSMARKVADSNISKVTCGEHGMSIDCMVSLGLEEFFRDEDDEDILDELSSDGDDEDITDELVTDDDDLD